MINSETQSDDFICSDIQFDLVVFVLLHAILNLSRVAYFVIDVKIYSLIN